MELLYLCVKHRDNGFHLRGKNWKELSLSLKILTPNCIYD